MSRVFYNNLAPNAPTSLLLSSVSRPTLALGQFHNLYGDSTTFGVGSATGSDYPNRMRALGTGVTAAFNGGTGSNNGSSIVMAGNGGVGGENSASILARMVTQSASFSSEMGRHSYVMQGLNDYNTGVSGWSRDWPTQVKTNYASEAALITGGKKLFAMIPPADNASAPGLVGGADYRYHFFDMQATYVNLVLDMGRYMRFKRELEAPASTTADGFALANGYLPYTYRGDGSGADFTANDVAYISGAGAPSNLAYNENQIYWDTTGRKSYRKLGASGAGSWILTDTKHQSLHGNNVVARAVADLAMAVEGTGPPFVMPARFRIAADAANGATVGQLIYQGTATRFALRNPDDTPNTDYTVSSGGLITKNTGATLTSGVTPLAVVAENSFGVLASVADIFVARASTVTAPAMRTIASPGVSMTARQAHGMADGKKFSFAFYVNVANLTATHQLLVLNRPGSTPSIALSISIPTTGRLRVTATDSTNTLVVNLTAVVGDAITVGPNVWFVGSVDCATNSRAFYKNETAMTMGAVTNGANLQFSDSNPTFLSAGGPGEFYDGASNLIGGIGFMAFWDDYIDWTNATNRRALYDAAGVPATRTPYAAIGGIVPRFEQWGGKGDWLYGTPDGSYAKMMSISARAKTLLS